ncbi:MAG: ABC transporter permease [Anaerolineales bacterium]|jgi:peptide/nickel transport system permease protein|nr:ABC transporter permease [Anaerolineales bacterium]
MADITPPSVFEEVLPESIKVRKIGRLEHFLGPENYRIVRGLFTTPASIAGLVLIVFFATVALLAPVLAPIAPNKDPYKIPRDGFSPDPKPPMTEWKRYPPPLPFWWEPVMGTDQWKHLMGTASGQWDIYYGVIWGTRTAFWTGLLITSITVMIGVLVGVISAYYGGLLDNILMRIVDIFMTLPFIMAALILAAVLIPVLGRSVMPAVIALISFGWMGYARLVRGDILSVRERDYVLAARVIGVKDQRIMFRHILPNAIFPTLVLASGDVGGYVLSFAALSFLGIGTDIGYADWGQLLSFARSWITSLGTYWYIVVFPGVTLVLFVLGWNLLGDALRDILDPKMRGVK